MINTVEYGIENKLKYMDLMIIKNSSTVMLGKTVQ